MELGVLLGATTHMCEKRAACEVVLSLNIMPSISPQKEVLSRRFSITQTHKR